MAPIIPFSPSARTGAISATAVISATGLLAAPAQAAELPQGPLREAPTATTALAVAPHTVARVLAPAAAPVILSAGITAAAPSAKQTHHTVVRGDTVWDLARHYDSTVTAIIDANGLDKRATIHVGDRLVIPGADAASSQRSTRKASPTSSSSKKAATHTVKAGDTVWDLAHKYGSSVGAIVTANNLGNQAVIHVGDRLTIPGATSGTSTKSTAKATSKTRSTTASSHYTVKSGDTLSKIATRFNTTVSKLASTNNLSDPSLIRVGQVLTISGGVPTGLVGDTFAGRTYAKDIVDAANVNKHTLNQMDVPSRAQMRALIVRTAKKHGVNVSLALAVAYQESGFNMRAVSPANAVGVMQVIPSTGEWMSTVVGRDLNLLDPEDNVTAGVVLLKYLTRNASSLDQAIAGYYQGLGGVRKYGMNSDTKRYVKSVRALMKQFD